MHRKISTSIGRVSLTSMSAYIPKTSRGNRSGLACPRPPAIASFQSARRPTCNQAIPARWDKQWHLRGHSPSPPSASPHIRVPLRTIDDGSRTAPISDPRLYTIWAEVPKWRRAIFTFMSCFDRLQCEETVVREDRPSGSLWWSLIPRTPTQRHVIRLCWFQRYRPPLDPLAAVPARRPR